VSTPDFEVTARLRARQVIAHVPPDAHTETEGEDVSVVREQRCSGLPAEMESGVLYSDVLVEKRLVGEKHASGECDPEA
jgi:hypothetical protein